MAENTYNKWNDPKWLEELQEAEDKAFSGGVLGNGMVVPPGVGAISPRILELLNKEPTVDITDFAKKRHLEKHQFTHFDGNWDELCNRTRKKMLSGDYTEVKGRPGVYLVQMGKKYAKDFYGYDGFKKFEGMKIEAVVEKVVGREHEPAKLQIKIHEPKIRMRYVDIVIYRRDILVADGDHVSDASWQIVSVNGRLHKGAAPMDPLTIVRNWKSLPGGSPMPDADLNDVLDELCDAVLYDKGMKHLIRKKK